jgi:hypothetical protein
VDGPNNTVADCGRQSGVAVSAPAKLLTLSPLPPGKTVIRLVMSGLTITVVPPPPPSGGGVGVRGVGVPGVGDGGDGDAGDGDAGDGDAGDGDAGDGDAGDGDAGDGDAGDGDAGDGESPWVGSGTQIEPKMGTLMQISLNANAVGGHAGSPPAASPITHVAPGTIVLS